MEHKGSSYELMDFLQRQREAREKDILAICNERTERFGLVLSEADRQELIQCRNQSLKKYRRVEFGSGILDKLIDAFCDSQFISQDNYLKTLERLQDIFYEFKNEVQDKMSDDELLHFMREQFETVCFGEPDYLEGTCLPRLAAAVRSGYRGYEGTDGYGEYARFSEEERWSGELYYEAKALYEELGKDFHDYGCRNYRDTILKGMPAFFLRYDMAYEPQNHILTMDYPLIYGLPDRCGVDMILEYLQGIRKESRFLSFFAPDSVRDCLREMSPDFPEYFMDNLCYPVLWKSIVCVITDSPVYALKLPQGGREAVSDFFRGDSREKAVIKIQNLIRLILKKASAEELYPYFAPAAEDYAARHCLDNL